jgi:hypothetical protein
MLLTTDTLINKTTGNTTFYVLAWLPVAVVIIFMIRGMAMRRKRGDK